MTRELVRSVAMRTADEFHNTDRPGLQQTLLTMQTTVEGERTLDDLDVERPSHHRRCKCCACNQWFQNLMVV